MMMRFGRATGAAPSRPGVRRKATRIAAALAILLHHFIQPYAFLLRTIEAVVARKPGFDRAFDEREAECVGIAQLGDVVRSTGAVEGVRAAFPVFETLEVRQHVGIAPAVVAKRRPMVVVRAMAARAAHRVDRAGAAEHAATRPEHPPPRAIRFGFGAEPPVAPAAAHQRVDSERHPHEEAVIRRTGFQHAHPNVRVLAQPCGQHATGRAITHDDVVVHGNP